MPTAAHACASAWSFPYPKSLQGAPNLLQQKREIYAFYRAIALAVTLKYKRFNLLSDSMASIHLFDQPPVGPRNFLMRKYVSKGLLLLRTNCMLARVLYVPGDSIPADPLTRYSDFVDTAAVAAAVVARSRKAVAEVPYYMYDRLPTVGPNHVNPHPPPPLALTHRCPHFDSCKVTIVT